MALTLFHNISELITNQGVAAKRGIGITESDLGIIKDAAVLYSPESGVLWYGKTKSIPRPWLKKTKRKISLAGKTVGPCFADSHTHLVFAGERHNELKLRLDGMSYLEISKQGGGIKSSVRSTRTAAEAELLTLASQRLETAKSFGTGIIEIKSGYGLDWPTERKTLEVVSKLKKKNKELLIHSTFLGAHAFPPEAKTPAQQARYVDTLCAQMIPDVARLRLAEACDVFFDRGFFNEQQSRRILNTARHQGLKIKIHADELSNCGGASLAAELGAISADHLLMSSLVDLKKMAQNNVTAVLLPGTAFYLGLKYADLKRFRKAKVCLALATDFNPGTSPTLSMPFIMSLACLEMGMRVPEAFAAATYGGARALGVHQDHGQISIGKSPKLSIWHTPTYESLIAEFASAPNCEGFLY